MALKLQEIEISSCNVRQIDSDTDVDSLIESIKNHQLISKMVVRKTAEGKYELVAGQRRFKALMELHGPEHELNDSEVVIRENMSDEDAFLLSIEENTQRLDLSPMEMNRAGLRLNQMGFKDKDIARALNISPHRLKRIYHLSEDGHRIPEEAKEELKKPVEQATFNDAHWEKLRNVDDEDVVKDVVDFIKKKDTPPREVPTVIKAVEKQYKDVGDGTGKTSYTAGDDDGAPENPGGPIEYAHKGELTLEVNGDEQTLRVAGKGEEAEVPVEHYLEYLRHPEKFKCMVTFKLKVIPRD